MSEDERKSPPEEVAIIPLLSIGESAQLALEPKESFAYPSEEQLQPREESGFSFVKDVVGVELCAKILTSPMSGRATTWFANLHERADELLYNGFPKGR